MDEAPRDAIDRLAVLDHQGGEGAVLSAPERLNERHVFRVRTHPLKETFTPPEWFSR
jgi:hypothetical protein